MIDTKLILNNSKMVKENLSKRSNSEKIIKDIDFIYSLLIKRNELLSKLNGYQASRNEISKEIGIRKMKKIDCSDLLKQMEEIKTFVLNNEKIVSGICEQIDETILNIPNMVLDEIPKGEDENNNVVLHEYPNLGRGLYKKLKEHYEIAVEKNLLDFTRATKLSGSRFVVYKNKLAQLVRALENFFLDEHSKNGYEEILPPVLVTSAMLKGTGQLPKFKEDLFKIENEDLYLIPTAEVPITNYYNNEIMELASNKKITAFTNCFRSEAGSAGKDTKGIIRMHQFNKVECVQFAREDSWEKAFNDVLNDAKNLLIKLEIPFREVLLCSGDTGFSSRKTIDLELWLPSEQRYREVSSISYFGDFQGRRAKIRYKNENQETKFVHTINGSGLAIDRVVAAILENYQNDDESITIPKVLLPYLKFDKL